ncbi:MAG: electron transfer flavoprotein subunit alpha/FixB family protein [Candidatus Marinimicrobia bacterium]|nr:electron transfer flavoprotein subunit alpha/FixB family protein [Candidatus Neomarinimicrobiota bacterium]
MGDILVITEHLKGEFQDITFEMLGKAKELAGASGGQCVAVTFGSMSGKAEELGAADSVISVGGNDDFNPESYAAAVQSVVSAKSPFLVMVGSTSMGMDIANPVATALEMPTVAYCGDIRANGDGFSCTSSIYGGKMNIVTNVEGPAVVMVLAGSFKAEAGRASGSLLVEEFSAESGAGKVRFKQLIEPEAADVDITQSEIIVAVGRGIGSKDDIEIAEELAEILNADLACSRPLVDSGWMSKSRQVGKSGMKVKPKVYIALGISGAPEHIEGMKNSSTIIAINTDKNAPIFDVAHYGMTEDLFDVVEELTEELE